MSDLKFGHLYFSWPPLTAAALEVRWKTSNFIVDFDGGKREEFGVPLCEIINFEYVCIGCARLIFDKVG